jgi:hypothetical protein
MLLLELFWEQCCLDPEELAIGFGAPIAFQYGNKLTSRMVMNCLI